MGSKERRERRRKQGKSAARRRADQHSSGISSTTLELPDGLGFWEKKEGTHTVDIVPYKVGKGNPFAEEGEYPYYERTYWVWRNIGPSEDWYVCLSKTFNEPDPIQEYLRKELKNPDADEQFLKSLKPSERQIFLIYDHNDKKKGVQLFEMSHHMFGKLLDSRIKNAPEDRGWDFFYYPDDLGFTLEITFEEEKPYGLAAKSIDFIEREEDDELPDEVKNHGYCLDDMIVKTPYHKLKAQFYGISEDEEDDESREPARKTEKADDKKDEKSKRRKSSSKSKKEDEPKESDEVSEPTADELGFAKGDEVEYEGETCQIFRILKDGLSCNLVDSDDEVIKDVKISKLRKPKKSKESKESSKDDDDDDVDMEEEKEKEERAKSSSKSKSRSKAKNEDDDDDWDDDWDDE